MKNFRELIDDAEKVPHTMRDITTIIDNHLNMLKSSNKKQYKEIICDIYKAVHGEHMDKEMAEKAVSKMQNEDGTTGEHWSIAQVDTVIRQNGIPLTDYNLYDFYYVLNMLYSDFYKILGTDANNYIKMARAWLEDKDVPKGKAFRYYMHVTK